MTITSSLTIEVESRKNVDEKNVDAVVCFEAEENVNAVRRFLIFIDADNLF